MQKGPLIRTFAAGSRHSSQSRLLGSPVARITFGGLLLVGGAAVAVGLANAGHRGPRVPSEIFSGVVYGCENLDPSAEGRGLLHWVKVDLTAPGIELYVTPLDPRATAQGWQYRLKWTSRVIAREHLAVAANGMMFDSKSFWKLRLPGDLARGVETAVADHVASHISEHTYLLWFDSALTPHLRRSKPPSLDDLAQAKWGIGGQGIGLYEGKVSAASDWKPDSRTAVAVDAERKLFFIAVGEHISPRLILEKLAALGGREGMLLDGGGSSSMVIGEGARGLSPGVLYGGWRAVATHIGVRARVLE